MEQNVDMIEKVKEAIALQMGTEDVIVEEIHFDVCRNSGVTHYRVLAYVGDKRKGLYNFNLRWLKSEQRFDRFKFTPPGGVHIQGMDVEKYNGGITCMDFGSGFKFPLPFPGEGKKWAVRYVDTRTGALIPDLVQVGKDEPNSGWAEGYPKYDFKEEGVMV